MQVQYVVKNLISYTIQSTLHLSLVSNVTYVVLKTNLCFRQYAMAGTRLVRTRLSSSHQKLKIRANFYSFKAQIFFDPKPNNTLANP